MACHVDFSFSAKPSQRAYFWSSPLSDWAAQQAVKHGLQLKGIRIASSSDSGIWLPTVSGGLCDLLTASLTQVNYPL